MKTVDEESNKGKLTALDMERFIKQIKISGIQGQSNGSEARRFTLSGRLLCHCSIDGAIFKMLFILLKDLEYLCDLQPFPF